MAVIGFSAITDKAYCKYTRKSITGAIFPSRMDGGGWRVNSLGKCLASAAHLFHGVFGQMIRILVITARHPFPVQVYKVFCQARLPYVQLPCRNRTDSGYSAHLVDDAFRIPRDFHRFFPDPEICQRLQAFDLGDVFCNIRGGILIQRKINPSPKGNVLQAGQPGGSWDGFC